MRAFAWGAIGPPLACSWRDGPRGSSAFFAAIAVMIIPRIKAWCRSQGFPAALAAHLAYAAARLRHAGWDRACSSARRPDSVADHRSALLPAVALLARPLLDPRRPARRRWLTAGLICALAVKGLSSAAPRVDPRSPALHTALLGRRSAAGSRAASISSCSARAHIGDPRYVSVHLAPPEAARGGAGTLALSKARGAGGSVPASKARSLTIPTGSRGPYALLSL
jgi:hypothetical protein